MSLEVNITKKLDGFILHANFAARSTATAILGASGCGKSMTLRCIAGIVRPDEGRIVLDGRVLFDSAQGIDLPPQQRNVGLLFHFQAHVRFPPCFCLRSSRLTASSTTAEITISTSTHCMAPASSLVRQSW